MAVKRIENIRNDGKFFYDMDTIQAFKTCLLVPTSEFPSEMKDEIYEYFKERNEDEDDGIDDPDFDPENPEECIDMKVVFTEKYKYKPKKTKTCIGSVCTFFKQIYTNIFIDKSLCSHDKVKEFFGDEYKTIYKLKDTDFKESILTLLKTCRPGSKNNILYNNLYVTLLENVSVSEEKGSDLKIFNNDNRYTSNLFFNIYVNLRGEIVYRDIWEFDIKKQYIIQVVIPGHIFV